MIGDKNCNHIVNDNLLAVYMVYSITVYATQTRTFFILVNKANASGLQFLLVIEQNQNVASIKMIEMYADFDALKISCFTIGV